MHSGDDLAVCFGDCNGYVSRHNGGFDEVMEGRAWRKSKELGRKKVTQKIS